MATIKIRSGLDSFRLIASITEVTPKAIFGETTVEERPCFTLLEAMAQLAALHARQCVQFQRHAFLLKVQQCPMPDQRILDGVYRLSAKLTSHSSNAFGYDMVAVGPRGEQMAAKLLIGTQGYDDRFQKRILGNHYRQLMTDLMLKRA